VCRGKAFRRRADSLRDFQKSLIPVGMLRHRPSVGGNRIQFAERSSLPITGAKDDGNDNSLARLVALHRTLHFFLVAIFRVKKVGPDEKQDNIVGLDMMIDLFRKMLAAVNPSIMPDLNDALPLKKR
jgi:hypothetical protein